MKTFLQNFITICIKENILCFTWATEEVDNKLGQEWVELVHFEVLAQAGVYAAQQFGQHNFSCEEMIIFSFKGTQI